MSSEKQKGKRRGRKPKEAKDPACEIPGMFVLPPNILQKLGINFNMEDIQDAQTSASPVTLCKEIPCVQHMMSAEVDRKTEDCSILETANLMKSSVFLSPTFIHPITNTNIINEIEFLSLNQDASKPAAAVEEQVSEDTPNLSTPKTKHRNTPHVAESATRKKGKSNRNKTVTFCPSYYQDSTEAAVSAEEPVAVDAQKLLTPVERNINSTDRDTPDTETKTRKKRRSQRDNTVTVASEYKQTSLDIHTEMIENLRKKIQSTIESVLANPEEMQVHLASPGIAASSDALVDYSIPENVIRDLSDHLDIVHTNNFRPETVQSTDAVEPEHAVISINTVISGNVTSKINETLKKNKSHRFEPKLNAKSTVDYFNETAYAREACNSYLDSKAIDKSPNIIEALIELNDAEKMLSDEMEIENVETENVTNVIAQQYHAGERLQFPSSNELTNVFDMQSNNDLNNINPQIFKNLESHKQTDSFAAEKPHANMPQENYGSGLRIVKSKVGLDIIESERPVLIAAEADMLLDDHLDEAYLSDCSNSNLGPSGNTVSVQEVTEPMSKQDSCFEGKNSKISILSQEIIEPSRFNNILQKAKQFHQKENFIPVSINTVVSLGHRNASPDYAKEGLKYQEMSREKYPDTMHFVESVVNDKPVLIEFIDEYEQSDQHSLVKVTENQPQPHVNFDTVSEANIFLQTSKEEANENMASLMSPLSSMDEIIDVVNLSSNGISDNANPDTESKVNLSNLDQISDVANLSSIGISDNANPDTESKVNLSNLDQISDVANLSSIGISDNAHPDTESKVNLSNLDQISDVANLSSIGISDNANPDTESKVNLSNLDQISDVANLSSNGISDDADPVTESKVDVQISEGEDIGKVSSSLPPLSISNEVSDGTNTSSGVSENHKDNRDQDTKSEVKEIASYLAKFAHILAHRKKNTMKKIRKKAQNFQKGIIKSSFRKEGVEKPGGADKNYESQEEDECQSHKIWRTYKISQKLPRIPCNNLNSCNALNITTDKITLENSTAIDDIKIDFDLSDDFGSLCYYETTEDLYEHFKCDDIKISLEELFHEVHNCTDVIYSAVAILDDTCCSTTKKQTVDELVIKYLDDDNELVKDDVSYLEIYKCSEDKDQNTETYDRKHITENEASDRKKEFDGMESYVNDLLKTMDIDYLRKHELGSDDDNQIEVISRHFEFDEEALSNEETETDGGLHQSDVDKPNVISAIFSNSINFPPNEVTVPEMSAETLKRRHSAEVDIGSTTQQGCSVSEPSCKKKIRCGVCYRTLSDDEWNEHLSNEHCYVAWKDGETIDLKSNVLLSNLNKRLKIHALLRCTFCNAEYRACKKFLSHVRQCLEAYNTSETALGCTCKCGVCPAEVESEKWFEHIMTKHNYIAWREGDAPIERKNDIKRHLESVLMLHGCLKCSECGKKYKNVSSFTEHTKTCGRNGSNDVEEILRQQSTDSESDIKISDLQELKRSFQKPSISNRSSSLRKSLVSAEPLTIKSKSRIRQTVESPKSLRGHRKIGDSDISKNEVDLIEKTSELKQSCTSSEESSNYSLEVEFVKRNFRKSSTDETRLPINENDKLLITKVPKTKCKEKKERKRNRLVSIEIYSSGISEATTPETIKKDNDINSEEPGRDSLKSVSKRSLNISKGEENISTISGHSQNLDEVDETNKSVPLSSRRSTQETKTYSKHESELTKQGRSKSTNDCITTNEAEGISSGSNRNSAQGNATTSAKNETENSSFLGNHNCKYEPTTFSQNIACDLSTKIKLEFDVNEETSVECSICQDRVASSNWMSHSHTKHQYLAWHTEEKVLNLDDEIEVLEHLKNLIKSLGSIVCAKCGLVRKQARKFLTHVRRCDVSIEEAAWKPTLENNQKEAPWKPTLQNDRNIKGEVTTNETVTCAICSQDVQSHNWKTHAFNQHYNIAWPAGGEPIDLRNKWHIEKVLKAYKLSAKVLQCKVCGTTRASHLGFYAHILACGKTKEELDKFKDECEICHQKYLCIYKQQHYTIHAQQEAAKERKKSEKEKKKKEKVSEESLGKRKAAEKARKFVLESYVDIKTEFMYQCLDCDFGTDSKVKWHSHRCAVDSDDEESIREAEAVEETEDEEEEEDDDEDHESGAKKRIRKRRPVDFTKARIAKVPFQVEDIKSYLKKSDKDFCNFHYTSERLFADWIPAHYEAIPDSDKRYWPPLEESCKVKEKDEWTTFKTFEAKWNRVPTFFTGASPQCVSWAPPIYNSDNSATNNYLAIACHDSPDMPRLNYDRTFKHKGLIQIWDFGHFDGALPRISLCIAHEFGTVWAMDWCPSGARDPPPATPAPSHTDCRPARLGLLALACSDGAAYVIAVPYPSTMPSGSGVFHKVKPVAELRYDDQKKFQCSAIKWSSQKGHSTVAAGYSDGSVAFYNLNGGSPLGQSEEHGVWILYPYNDEKVHSSCIAGVDLFPSTDALSDNGLACAASVNGLDMWAGRGVAKSHVHAAVAGAAFQPHWPTVLCAGEEPFTVVDVDWDGWRGRAGPRQIAVSPRTGVVAGYFAPVIRTTIPHRLHKDPQRQIIAAIEMKPLSMKRKKELANTELQMKVEPLSYEKVVASYGLEMTQLKNVKPSRLNNDEYRPERYPLSEVTTMAFCPDAKYATKLAVATHAGIVYLFNVTTKGLIISKK